MVQATLNQVSSVVQSLVGKELDGVGKELDGVAIILGIITLGSGSKKLGVPNTP